MPLPRLSSQQVSQLSDWVATYIRDQRSHFLGRAKLIRPDQRIMLGAFFPEDILCAAKVTRGRASQPPFYSQLPAMGISNAPPFSDVAGITFEDVIVHVGPLETSLLFHELVHAVQYKHLGLDRFAECYVRGFLTRGSYEEIPLEEQAYKLEDKFVRYPAARFSVEAEVRERIRRNQF